jgi:8-oxo-dGTP pyrophosphatase MutT (NUDIX family)
MSHRLLSIIYRILYPVAKTFWFIFRPKTFGVRCLIECNGRLLFICQTYGAVQWTIPGGGIKKKETPEAAIQREVKEEVGILLSEIYFLGKFINTEEYKIDTVYCYFGKIKTSNLEVDKSEVRRTNWFPWNNLPEQQSVPAQMSLKFYQSQARH